MADKQTTEDTPPGKHILKLYRGSIELIKDMLKQPIWYKDNQENGDYACLLTEHPLLSSQKVPKFPLRQSEWMETTQRQLEYAEEREEWNEHVLNPWNDELVEHEVDEEERDALKACIKWFRKEGRLENTKYVLCILRQLGMLKK